MSSEALKETAQVLQEQWELQLPDTVSEEELLKRLTARVIVLLERGSDSFFQLMYRLDIYEHKLNTAMQSDDPAAAIAYLIYERQLQKVESRLFYRNNKETKDDPELEW
ncbi:MAG: hypothetical protein H0X33_04110 [Taibaiella sp.]|nr:hypothetical protein [Taibaiella sp.]